MNFVSFSDSTASAETYGSAVSPSPSGQCPLAGQPWGSPWTESDEPHVPIATNPADFGTLVRMNRAPSLADYHIVVYPDTEGFAAYVPAIEGCHAVGDTREEVLSELEGVFKMVLEWYQERNLSLPADVKDLVPVAG